MRRRRSRVAWTGSSAGPRTVSTWASPCCWWCRRRCCSSSPSIRRWTSIGNLSSDPIVEVLDTLLLVFIVVELLSAVRTTLAERQLLAEPFLIVGIIASIKEIVVLSVKAAEEIGKGAAVQRPAVADRRAGRRRRPARHDRPTCSGARSASPTRVRTAPDRRPPRRQLSS